MMRYENISPVLEALLGNYGLQSIVDASAKSLGNPFWIVDMNSNYMANIAGETQNPHLLEENKLKSVDDDLLSNLTENRIRDQINTSNEPYFFEANDGSTILTCAVKIGRTPVAYISCIEEHKKLEAQDVQKMNMIAQVISTELQKDTFYKDNKEIMYSYLLADLLENKLNSNNIEHRLNAVGYTSKKYNYLLTVSLGDVENRHIILDTIQKQLTFICPNSIYCLYREHSVVLFSVDKKLSSDSTLYRRLETFLKDSSLKCGFSNSFHDLMLVPRHYAKTLHALNIGIQYYPKQYIYHYDTLVTDHALNVLSTVISCHDFRGNIIDILWSYDQTYNSQLMATLYEYLGCSCRISTAAANLNIHQNTLRNRLQTISSMTGLDYENGHQCFETMLALKLYYHERT